MLGEPMEKYQRTLRRRLVKVLKPSVFANWHLFKLTSYHPTETGRENYFLTITFLKDGPQLLEKDISCLQKGSSQRGRETSYYFKFSEINVLIKRRSGAFPNQEKIYLKFSQAEGMLRPSWSMISSMRAGTRHISFMSRLPLASCFCHVVGSQ